jgi:ribosomal protein L30E
MVAFLQQIVFVVGKTRIGSERKEVKYLRDTDKKVILIAKIWRNLRQR